MLRAELAFSVGCLNLHDREGSRLARDILRALVEHGVRIVFVTHLFDLAHSLYDEAAESTLFLRAERLADGSRTFRLTTGEPQLSSHGEDIYHRVFGGVRSL
ncbi:hypothetical protein EV652_114240 [Kribbella steppae]|uniref:Uncharacterized protein n=1 Tax=Kribbella steppae TaxID=2512223 RepID=A0A4R2H2M5_9ACTN|nr:hypothetical protein [Kribbella steppae]TCO19259.1 hypothetical protein EV652_114240 [Kribbella steppae]